MSRLASINASQIGGRASCGPAVRVAAACSVAVPFSRRRCTWSCNPWSASSSKAGIALPVSRASASSKPFCAGVRSKGVISIPRQYQENHGRARSVETVLHRVTGARDVLQPSLRYPAVAPDGSAGLQQRLEGGHVVCHGQQQDLVAFTLSTRLIRATDGSRYYSSAMRLRPYLANRSFMASTRRAWVVRSCWTASNLNCFAASGTTCAAINCRPCLLLPLAVVLGVAISCTAAGAWEPLFSGVNVSGLRLLIDVSSMFTRLGVCTFGCFYIYAFGCLQRQGLRQPLEERSHLGGSTTLRLVFLRGPAVIHRMGECD